MNFVEAIRSVWSKYWVTAGRAGRAEFGYWSVLVIVAQFLLTFGEDVSTPLLILSYVFASVVAFPTMNVSIRRLHDADMSGGWLLLVGMVSFLFSGVVANIVYAAILWVIPGTQEKNRYDEQKPANSYALAISLLLCLLLIFVAIEMFIKETNIIQQQDPEQMLQQLQEIQKLLGQQ